MNHSCCYPIHLHEFNVIDYSRESSLRNAHKKQQRKLQNIKTIKTMKTNTIRAFITLCIVSLTSARLSRNNPSSSAAFTYGYNQARTLFNNGRGGRGRGGYSCRKLDDVLVGFWPDVKRQVFATCESNYRLWATNIQQCKSGAEKFAMEKASECMALSDCHDLGDIAADGVAGVFCSRINYRSPSNNFFPPTCVSAAKSRCKNNVVDNVQSLADARQCGNVRSVLRDLGQSDIRKLDQACENEVNQMARSAQLP
jgi:hypothetical protein